MYWKFIFFISLFTLLACNGAKYTPLDYPKDSIAFGYTGGIANLTTEYCLLDNGQLFKKLDGENYESLKKIDSKQNEQLFGNVDFLSLRSMELKDPGNKTNFIRLKGDMGTTELAWGGNQSLPSTELTVFYSSLMNLVKKEN